MWRRERSRSARAAARGRHGTDRDGERHVDTVTDAQGITPKDLAPTPGNVACTEIYGGDATASIKGTIDGEPVDAEFSLQNGCEIDRWNTAAPLLGEPPRM